MERREVFGIRGREEEGGGGRQGYISRSGDKGVLASGTAL